MLELWRPPGGAGDPVGCLSTTYTFTPSLFDEQCLARFLEIDSDPDREDLAFLLERENRLGSVYAGILVDHTQAGVEHSLRWDVLPVRIPSGKQHAKLSVLAWTSHLRLIVASANLSEAGYRTNHEVAATVEFSSKEADRDLFTQAIAFLRDLLAFVPGARATTPEVQRAQDYLAQVERMIESWGRPRRKGKVRQQFAFTLPSVRPGGVARSSLEESIAICRRRGPSPHEAWIASPFFDFDDRGRVAAALCQSMARGRTREIRLCVPAVADPDDQAPARLRAPKALVQAPLPYRGQVTVEKLPDSDEEKNPRPWHAKMLRFRGDRYTALQIGSSNFTAAGMGLDFPRNAEANLVTLVKRGSYGREAAELEAIWPSTDPVVDPESAEWLGALPDHDEEERARAPVLPSGFLSGIYRAGDERQIVLHLDPERLPSEWKIYACGPSDREILASFGWSEMGSPKIVHLPWSPPEPPRQLRVSWDGLNASLPLNVENSERLPPPSHVQQMSADDLLGILASADPSAAFRAWARRNQVSETFDSELDSAIPIDLDPLRRHDLQATFLHRIRRRARVLAQLRANLERPVWGRTALEWRLRGMIGVETLAERLVREVVNSEGPTDEALLTLADFLIVLREVNYRPGEGSLSSEEFKEVFRHFLQELADRLPKQVAPKLGSVSAELAAFWARVLEQCR